jgi:hypothetical protein
MDITTDDIIAITGAILGIAAVFALVGKYLKTFIRANTAELREAFKDGLDDVKRDTNRGVEEIRVDVTKLRGEVRDQNSKLNEHMSQERVTTAMVQQQLTAHDGSINTLGAVLGMTWRKGPEWQSITLPVQSGEHPTSVLVTPVTTSTSEDS